ncbi:hypothetical protein CLAFUW4_10628 [Fulvia fulva]|nr:hypothetical protein CLAFUR4_10633 [Fulvia fulva]WPV19425.1 hypothetical protein CLAFUW4_10628 [Fulvia fulva]WPV34495.1 hypothetical protein CLAFUW7_10630 [Fulvia fulva]
MTVDDVLKRTNSSCLQGVIINPRDEHRLLLGCRSGEPDEKIAKRFVQKGTEWFHQEKVLPLRDFDQNGLRGRTSYVFEAIHTAQESNAKGAGAITKRTLNRVGPELLDKKHCGNRTYADLEAYTLCVFDQLRRFEHQSIVGVERNDAKVEEVMTRSKRKRGSDEDGEEEDVPAPKKLRPTSPVANSSGEPVADAAPLEEPSEDDQPSYILGECGQSTFESLEVGVRLDIGISTARNGHRFFVNEISREWYVDYFTFVHGNPRTKYCTAFANARNHYFFGSEDETEEPPIEDDDNHEAPEGSDSSGLSDPRDSSEASGTSSPSVAKAQRMTRSQARKMSEEGGQ